MSHLKEALKIQFIKQAIQTFRQNNYLGRIDFTKSLYVDKKWNIVFSSTANKSTVASLVADIMSQWFFSNLSKNENIYYYRFLNIFRQELSIEEWSEAIRALLAHTDLNTRENTAVYLDYRNKLLEIEELIKQRVTCATTTTL